MWIRNARPREADALTQLALRSKAHWGYPSSFLDSCRDDLTIAPHHITSHRLVVAEDDTGILGLASLQGDAPLGTLGSLFVEPRAIRRGVGRTLYAHVVDAARALGFTRLVIDSDPHAVDFYRALGAHPVPGQESAAALPRLEARISPRPAWAQAWTGGHRAVHIGNVAAYQEQFAAPTAAPADTAAATARLAADHYSCLAAFASPHPAALVLPRAVPVDWIRMVARQLAWAHVEVYDDLTVPALLARPALVARLRGLGLPFVPWGYTEATGELSGVRIENSALRHESKAHSHALFRRLAPGHPSISVPERWTPATRRAAARLVRARARTGAATVVKAEHGAGGSGTRVLTGRIRASRLPRGPLLLEEYVTGGGTPSDPTYDGLVDADGQVHDVGVAAMAVTGTAYGGATVGPGAVPDELAAHAVRFGHAVGRELAAAGYRGWYDVDFVAAPGGRLAPTETNLRLTGPSAAFMVKLRLDETRGGDHLVRSLDGVPLGARLPEAELIAFLDELTVRAAGIDAVLVPSIPTAAYEPDPYVGVIVAARTKERLDAAEALVRAAAHDLARMFR